MGSQIYYLGSFLLKLVSSILFTAGSTAALGDPERQEEPENWVSDVQALAGFSVDQNPEILGNEIQGFFGICL